VTQKSLFHPKRNLYSHVPCSSVLNGQGTDTNSVSINWQEQLRDTRLKRFLGCPVTRASGIPCLFSSQWQLCWGAASWFQVRRGPQGAVVEMRPGAQVLEWPWSHLSVFSCAMLSFLRIIIFHLFQEIFKFPFLWDQLLKNYCVSFKIPCFLIRGTYN
jgi:hypothetical protein